MTLHVLGRDPVPDPSPEALADALDEACRGPHPRVVLEDDLGRLLRAEGRRGSLLVDARTLEGGRVAWVVLGTAPPSETSSPVPLVGRVRKARDSELLDTARALAALEAFSARPALPEDLTQRPTDGEDGALAVLAGQDRDPRPVGGWPEVERYVQSLQPGRPAGFALSRPDRCLFGVLGDGARFVAQLRESRGPRSMDRPVRRAEPDPTPTPLELGSDAPARRRDEILDKAELLAVLESVYRFEAPPPGFRA